ncbi:hypothetical protein GXB81_18150 [Paraburkholderia sp. Ac-20336]|uniref:hypothetical protein n=1 Tax=Paraburkholderia sp. Ac-20336 TaxID=2703886 RepID=UPI00197DDB63|nr:hypothetical protein [Paraburkholderia sp. Ac-20336]MBN3804958.1 hypothetical protein [Paraburkholderia sp. Ac-20336]
MSNSALQIHYTNFNSVYDNVVKPVLASWDELASMLVSSHPVVVGDKLALPSFSAWRYKSVDDPAIDHGTDKHGKPLKCFSETHVRRLKSNLVEMSMLVIDFDGGLPLDEVQQRFGEYEYVSFTSVRHRHEDKDKARVVLPFTEPMRKAEFMQRKSAIERWIGHDVADDVTYEEGQVFLLPAVYEKYAAHARAWRNEGALLDWRMFESIPLPAAQPKTAKAAVERNGQSEFRLMPNDVLETAHGPIKVKDIDRKISKVRCPFPSHGDVKPTEFVAVSKSRRPYLVCKKCGTVYMWQAQGDGIAEGLAMIAERKRLREKSEAKQ